MQRTMFGRDQTEDRDLRVWRKTERAEAKMEESTERDRRLRRENMSGVDFYGDVVELGLIF